MKCSQLTQHLIFYQLSHAHEFTLSLNPKEERKCNVLSRHGVTSIITVISVTLFDVEKSVAPLILALGGMVNTPDKKRHI